jgi:hypothetical protein
MSELYKIILPMLLWSSTASSQTLKQLLSTLILKWDKLSSAERVAYISGVIDTMINYTTDDDGVKWSRHYYSCIKRANMQNGQLANNLQKYVRARSDLQKGTVQEAMIHYLGELCGSPTQ